MSIQLQDLCSVKTIDAHDCWIQLTHKMKLRPKLDLLKKHKIGILAARPEGATNGGKAMTWRDIKECDPQTNELKALLTAQRQWQANKWKRGS